MELFVELLKEVNIAQIFIILIGVWSLYKRQDNKIEKLDKRIDKLSEKIDKIDQRIANVETRVAVIESKLTDINTNVSYLMWHQQTLPPKEEQK